MGHINQKTGRLISPHDLRPGELIQIFNHEFLMLDMDEGTSKMFSATSGEPIPRDRDSLIPVLEKFKESMHQQYPLVRDVFRMYDRDSNGVITLEEMKEALQKLAFHLTEDEVVAIMRHFDTRKDGHISYNEFCDAVLEQDYTNDQSEKQHTLRTEMDDGYKERAKAKTLMHSETEKVRRAAQELSAVVYSHANFNIKLMKEFASMTHMKTVNVEMVHAAFMRLGFAFDLDDVERAVSFFLEPGSNMDEIPYHTLLQSMVAGYHDLCCSR